MKIKEVIARAMSGAINWIQAAEILGMSDRQLRRWKKRWDKHGYEGLFESPRVSALVNKLVLKSKVIEPPRSEIETSR